MTSKGLTWHRPTQERCICKYQKFHCVQETAIAPTRVVSRTCSSRWNPMFFPPRWMEMVLELSLTLGLVRSISSSHRLICPCVNLPSWPHPFCLHCSGLEAHASAFSGKWFYTSDGSIWCRLSLLWIGRTRWGPATAVVTEKLSYAAVAWPVWCF